MWFRAGRPTRAATKAATTGQDGDGRATKLLQDAGSVAAASKGTRVRNHSHNRGVPATTPWSLHGETCWPVSRGSYLFCAGPASTSLELLLANHATRPPDHDHSSRRGGHSWCGNQLMQTRVREREWCCASAAGLAVNPSERCRDDAVRVEMGKGATTVGKRGVRCRSSPLGVDGAEYLGLGFAMAAALSNREWLCRGTSGALFDCEHGAIESAHTASHRRAHGWTWIKNPRCESGKAPPCSLPVSGDMGGRGSCRPIYPSSLEPASSHGLSQTLPQRLSEWHSTAARRVCSRHCSRATSLLLLPCCK